MIKKLFSLGGLVLLSIAPFTFAGAAEQVNNCKLKGGSMVLLAAGACVMEGGVDMTAPPPVVSLHLSDDPNLATAQRAVAELLIKPVIDKDIKKRTPEDIKRSVKFEGCRLIVDEDMNLEYGRHLSTRMSFKVSSTIDLRNISRDAYGIWGEVTSYGGGMKVYAVYFEERKKREGNNIAISMWVQRAGTTRKHSLAISGAYWDAQNDDLWMADEYGYPKDNHDETGATDKVRILYFMNTSEDAAALKKALDDVHGLCKP